MYSTELSGVRHRLVDTNGIQMHVAEAGTGYPVVFCHGFPELWYSWRHQMLALAAAGFHAIAPDMRGYGGTEAPPEISAYTQYLLVGDVIGLLDALGLPKAVVVGHDWGGSVAWQVALRHPERVERVVSLNTPYFPASPVPFSTAYREVSGRTGKPFYVDYFLRPGRAEAELEADVRLTFQKLMRPAAHAGDMLAFAHVNDDDSGVLTGIGPGETLLTEAELDVYVGTYQKTGFRGGLSWYRAADLSWEEERHLSSPLITVPALMVTAERDSVLRPDLVALMRPFVQDLRVAQVPDCAHWTQQEKPDIVNALLLDFLRDLGASR
ncbi:alpha/beta fold hydrolase [Chondromyces apiculatus]|uniref:Epoxide hydrolase n=1 Tax=Chondromyces apiculatus DSM 436 TaxID=1192034 RepID=A0A017T1W3_9BACT|nr:alpha/beta hydrolase [Chondromyces apiculatus]EYF02840.1 Epoxide hydrolase [Chondromyces apiculatus DSM 436]